MTKPEQICLTPLRLLGVVIKGVLKEKVTIPQINKICKVYYESLMDIWADPEDMPIVDIPVRKTKQRKVASSVLDDVAKRINKK